MPHMARFPGSWLVVLAATACTGSTEIVTPPPPPASGFTLRFVPEPEDGATAAALGWGGGLPGLTVTLTPADSSRPARTFTSEGDGTVAIPDLVAGDHIVEASRWLTAAERAELASGDDGDGFATRTVLRTGVGSTTIGVPASRRRSLVISEWAFNASGYYYGGYLALHNNADTTVFLDGMLLAEGLAVPYDVPAFPCAAFRPYADDPTGIWARFMEQFPGTGSDHPVAPGGTVIVATDAIDHRPLYSNGVDLSHADFEFAGSADVDNPDVPNLVDVGLASHSDGHGLYWQGLAAVVVVSLPVDVPQLAREVLPLGTVAFAKLPASRILDALALRPNYSNSPYPECDPLVNQAFDRAASDVRGKDGAVEVMWSVSRRLVPDLNLGHAILQATRSGYADYVRTRRSLGAAP
jgi:hypothetical protein